MKKAILTCVITLIIASFLAALPVQAEDTIKDMPGDDLDQLLQGAVSESPSIRNYSIRRALYLLSSSMDTHVSQNTKQMIETQFHNNINRQTILLAGLAGVESLSDEIYFWASQPMEEPQVGSFHGTNEWAANLVLARQGNTQSVARLLEFTKKQDLHTTVVFILIDLQYVPQPEIVDFLKGYLDSDERLEPVKSTVEGLPVANYAASSLARILQGFPVSYREDYSYSEREIRACRAWMSEQKEWKYR